MEYIVLKDDIKIPTLGFGTYQIQEEECTKAVISALKTGYRLLDTAQQYHNEEWVGKGIKESNIKREDIFLVTKVAFSKYDETEESIYESLRKLQTSYLDLVLLHWPYGNYYHAWRTLEKVYKQGIIKAIGVSNFKPDRLVDLINYNEIIPSVNQMEMHLYCQRKEEYKWEEKYNVRHMGYCPLGQYRAKEMFEEDAVVTLAEKYNKTPAQILLRFETQCGVIVIPKSTHEERIRENFDIFDFALTQEEIDSLKALDKNTPYIGNPDDPFRVERSKNW